VSPPPGTELLTNGTFDESVTGWTGAGPAGIQWSDVDMFGDPESGSAIVGFIATDPGRQGAAAFQCIPATPNTHYLFRAGLGVGAGQARPAFPGFRIAFHGAANCSDFPLDLEVRSDPEFEPGVFRIALLALTSPPGTAFAWVGLTTWADDGTPGVAVSTAWDNVSFVTASRVVAPGLTADQ
jgi:hypothetical protein